LAKVKNIFCYGSKGDPTIQKERDVNPAGSASFGCFVPYPQP
jgi:hypothetical protein